MKVAIIGTGLVGGSIGLALKDRMTDVSVSAFDRDAAAASRAVERGAADIAVASPAEAVRGADLVFVCTPVRAIANVVKSIAEGLEPGCIVTDTGSTKARVLVEVQGSLPPGRHFVGGHPMAGSEEEGIEAARPDLFAGSWWILTPLESVPDGAYSRLHGVLTTLGARPMALDAADHDELMAVISHVPQLVATTLMNEAVGRGRDHAALLALAAGGFRDVTRVAASNPDIWLDICRENGDAIAAALGSFLERLQQLRGHVAAGDEGAIQDALVAARAARRALPGPAVREGLYDIRFPVPDRPGVLAEVTTTVGTLGINIEDLSISHSAAGARGTLHLAVAGRVQAEAVVAALHDRGFAAQMRER